MPDVNKAREQLKAMYEAEVATVCSTLSELEGEWSDGLTINAEKLRTIVTLQQLLPQPMVPTHPNVQVVHNIPQITLGDFFAAVVDGDGQAAARYLAIIFKLPVERAMRATGHFAHQLKESQTIAIERLNAVTKKTAVADPKLFKTLLTKLFGLDQFEAARIYEEHGA